MVVRRALGITAISQAILFVLGIANVVIVSRLLKPEEIGIYSVSVSVLGLAHIFREFGVGEYLVQASSVSRQQFRAAFSVALLTSWFIAALLVFGRIPMSHFYGNEGIAAVLLLLAINFLILPLGTPVVAMLRREMQFGKLAWIGLVGGAVQTAVTIGTAMAGQSYLSMAWGSIAMTLSKIVLVNFMRPNQTFILPALSGLGEVARFGSVSSLVSIVRQLGASAPDLIFGRTLGFSEVAFFSRGVGLHRMVVERINALVRQVHFPSFASDLRKGGHAAELYARATNYLLAVTGPLLAVLAIVSQPLILFVFGPQWERSVLIAAVICSSLILTAPYSLYSQSLIADGKMSLCLRTALVVQIARVLILLTSIWFPLEQVVMLLSLSYLVEASAAQWALKRAFGLSWLMLMKAVWRALALIPAAAVGPALLVWAACFYGFEATHRLALLVGSAVLALAGWSLGVLLLQHPMKAELARIGARFAKLV